jgi:hypothetical protein
LAAVAVSSAAMAQVTISGKLRYAYTMQSQDTAGTVVKASGINRTDGDVVFSFAEDIGNGVKASGNFAIQTGARSVAAGNRDGNLMLSGGFGTVAFGSIDAGNGIIGLGGAGAHVIGTDSLIIPDSGNIDYVSYTTPAMSGVQFRVLATDDATVASSSNIQTGFGMGSTTAIQDSMVYGVTYAAGPLAFAADITVHGDNALAAATARADGRTRVSGSYDLGVAKIGAGWESRDAKASSTGAAVNTTDTIFGVTVPMGNLVLGANYAVADNEANAFKKKGTDIVVRYNLSKRTFVALQHQKVKGVNLLGAEAAANSGNITRIQVAHSF